MAKITSKLQVTLPKALAVELGLRPGDEIEWGLSAGTIRVTPMKGNKKVDVATRLELFDQCTDRQGAVQGAYRARHSGAVPGSGFILG